MGSKCKREGTEILAEIVLRIVRDRVLEAVRRDLRNGVVQYAYCHSMAEEMVGKLVGRVER